MNNQNNKIIQNMYDLTSKKYSVPDRSDFEIILDYYCSIFLKVYEQDISDPKQADLMSELYASSEEFLMTQFSRECRYARDFEELERGLLRIASLMSNEMRIEALPDSEKIPRDLRESISQFRVPGWVYLMKDDRELRKTKCGKWMYFFSDQYWAKKMCLKAIDENVVCEAKYTDDITGVACFYLNIDNYERHKKVIQFFIDNNLVKKTKAGKFANIAFKLDRQTNTKKYGKEFKGIIHLSDFIDLETGKFKD